MEQCRPLVLLSPLLLLIRWQLLPRLTGRLGDGLRGSLPGLIVLYCDCVNRLHFLPGLNESLPRVPCGCEEMTR